MTWLVSNCFSLVPKKTSWEAEHLKDFGQRFFFFFGGVFFLEGGKGGWEESRPERQANLTNVSQLPTFSGGRQKPESFGGKGYCKHPSFGMIPWTFGHTTIFFFAVVLQTVHLHAFLRWVELWKQIVLLQKFHLQALLISKKHVWYANGTECLPLAITLECLSCNHCITQAEFQGLCRKPSDMYSWESKGTPPMPPPQK